MVKFYVDQSWPMSFDRGVKEAATLGLADVRWLQCSVCRLSVTTGAGRPSLPAVQIVIEPVTRS